MPAPSLVRLAEVTRCPGCAGPLAATDSGNLVCLRCGRTAAAFNDVIDLSQPAGVTGHKQAQAQYFDRADHEYEVTRPVGTPAFHAWLLQEKLRRAVDALPPLHGRTVLAVCGGSGMDAEWLARHGAAVIVLDISAGAVRRAAERASHSSVDLQAIVADAERLPFRSRSIDLVFVHDGLHHLEHPQVALTEMARVSRWAISVNEPADAVVTRAAVRAHLSVREEESGNTVRRFSVPEVTDTLEREGWRIVKAERYGMLYRHEPGPLSRGLSRRRMLPAACQAMRLVNRVAGRLGNKLSVQAVRPRAFEP